VEEKGKCGEATDMRGMDGGAVQVARMLQGGAESGELQSSRPREDDNVS
jgi:hypothetical protein